jgi:hypothetical protein
MTPNTDRRQMLQLLISAAVPAVMPAHAFAASGAGREHDFDFFLGRWQVGHRRLKRRLASNQEWEEFAGATHCQSLLGGFANINDSIVNRSGGTYRSIGLRAFDAKTSTWADWYLSTRSPTRIDLHGKGRFAQGIGTFLSDDTYEDKPIKVRGLWTPIDADRFQWEQAFSADDGRSWETNWVMRFSRL